MYNDARVHRVKLSTVLSAQAFILAYEAAPLDDAMSESEDWADGDEEEGPGGGRAPKVSLYWMLALAGALAATITGLVARKMALV